MFSLSFNGYDISAGFVSFVIQYVCLAFLRSFCGVIMVNAFYAYFNASLLSTGSDSQSSDSGKCLLDVFI